MLAAKPPNRDHYSARDTTRRLATSRRGCLKPTYPQVLTVSLARQHAVNVANAPSRPTRSGALATRLQSPRWHPHEGEGLCQVATRIQARLPTRSLAIRGHCWAHVQDGHSRAMFDAMDARCKVHHRNLPPAGERACMASPARLPVEQLLAECRQPTTSASRNGHTQAAARESAATSRHVRHGTDHPFCTRHWYDADE